MAKGKTLQQRIHDRIMGATGADKVVGGLKNEPMKTPAPPRLKPRPPSAAKPTRAGGELKGYKDHYRD